MIKNKVNKNMYFQSIAEVTPTKRRRAASEFELYKKIVDLRAILNQTISG